MLNIAHTIDYDEMFSYFMSLIALLFLLVAAVFEPISCWLIDVSARPMVSLGYVLQAIYLPVVVF